MEAQYKSFNGQLLSVMIIMEDTRRGSGTVSPSYCNSYKSKYGFTFPTVVDERAAVMRPFLSGSIPMNMVISTSDMKIRFKMNGYSSRLSSAISQAISSP